MKPIPYGRQDISEEDIASVVAVLKSDFITQGPVLGQFEQAIASYCQVPFAFAVNSATSALHLACEALSIGQQDLVWTSPNTFVASANCARFCGAQVDFVDIDPKTYNLSAVALEEKLRKCRLAGRTLPTLLIVVHFAGQSCDMQAISTLADEYGFRVIEDASHAIGGQYQGEPVGNCRYSDACIFSFHPVKIITSGEGGVVVTRSEILAERINRLRTHGITRRSHADRYGVPEPWFYQQDCLGYNYRMTDIHAALGLSQMSRLDEFVSIRHLLALRYHQQLEGSGFQLPWQHPQARSSYHLYPVLVPDSKNRTVVRASLYHHLHQAGIAVNVHYIPVHWQPYYQQQQDRQGWFPEAEAYYERTLSLPLFSALTTVEQDRVIDAMWGFVQQDSLAA